MTREQRYRSHRRKTDSVRALSADDKVDAAAARIAALTESQRQNMIQSMIGGGVSEMDSYLRTLGLTREECYYAQRLLQRAMERVIIPGKL